MMDLHELNALLKPFNITIECDSCESDHSISQGPTPKPPKAQQVNKKIKKRSVKAAPLHFSEKKAKSSRNFATEKKPFRFMNQFFDDDIVASPLSESKATQGFAPKNTNFFFEFKQICDAYKNCPQFDNVNNCENVKRRDFDMDTAASSFELSEDGTSVSYDDLNVLKKDLFNHKDNLVMDRETSSAFEGCSDFELDFGQHSRFTEFFSFD